MLLNYPVGNTISHKHLTQHTNVYNMAHRVNIQKIMRDFTIFFIPEGFCEKHIVQFHINNKNIMYRKPCKPLKSGNKMRVFPPYWPGDETLNLLRDFIDLADIADNTDILVEAQRITEEYPCVVSNKVKGVYCASRSNIINGISEITDIDQKKRFVLNPGELIVSNNEHCEFNLTPVISTDMTKLCYKDIITFSLT
jgi:hypothetical protein